MDAAKPRSRLTLRELEVLKTEFSKHSMSVEIVNSVWIAAKVALPLGFIYWAFKFGIGT